MRTTDGICAALHTAIRSAVSASLNGACSISMVRKSNGSSSSALQDNGRMVVQSMVDRSRSPLTNAFAESRRWTCSCVLAVDVSAVGRPAECSSVSAGTGTAPRPTHRDRCRDPDGSAHWHSLARKKNARRKRDPARTDPGRCRSRVSCSWGSTCRRASTPKYSPRSADCAAIRPPGTLPPEWLSCAARICRRRARRRA